MASSAETTLNQSAALARRPAHPIPDLESRSIVDISPSEILRRNSASWSGFHVETVQVTQHTPFEYGFRAPCHLLFVPELGERYDGETFVEGLPRSTLRDFTRKLIFVPAEHDFRGWHKPRALRFGEIEFKPRLFFYDRKAQVAGREPGRDAQAIRRSARHRADARAHSHQRWRCAPRAGQSWRPCVLAAKAGGRLYRGACRRRHPARHPRRTGAAEPVPFLPLVQEFLRHAAAPLSRASPN